MALSNGSELFENETWDALRADHLDHACRFVLPGEVSSGAVTLERWRSKHARSSYALTKNALKRSVPVVWARRNRRCWNRPESTRRLGEFCEEKNSESCKIPQITQIRDPVGTHNNHSLALTSATNWAIRQRNPQKPHDSPNRFPTRLPPRLPYDCSLAPIRRPVARKHLQSSNPDVRLQVLRLATR